MQQKWSLHFIHDERFPCFVRVIKIKKEKIFLDKSQKIMSVLHRWLLNISKIEQMKMWDTVSGCGTGLPGIQILCSPTWSQTLDNYVGHFTESSIFIFPTWKLKFVYVILLCSSFSSITSPVKTIGNHSIGFTIRVFTWTPVHTTRSLKINLFHTQYHSMHNKAEIKKDWKSSSPHWRHPVGHFGIEGDDKHLPSPIFTVFQLEISTTNPVV